MAEFNPKVDKVDSQRYINFSERSSGNQAWGTLFEGVVASTDAAIKGKLQNQINKDVASANNEYFNLDEIAKAQAGADGNGYSVGSDGVTVQKARPGMSHPDGTDFRDLPKALQEGQKNIIGLGKAFENGTYSETNYRAQIEMRIKAMKAQYPGYAEDIDKMAATAMNNPTANQLRQSIYNDWADKQKQKSDSWSADYKYIMEKDNIKYLSQEQALRAASGQLSAEEMADAKRTIAAYTVADGQVKREHEMFQMARDDSNATLADKQDAAARYANASMRKTFRDVYVHGIGATGEAYKQFDSMVSKFQEDGKITPDEIQQITPLVNQLQSQLLKAKSDLLDSPDDKGTVLSQVLKPEQLKTIEDTFDAQMKVITDPLGGDIKKLSLLNLTTTLNEAEVSTALFDAYHTDVGQQLVQLKALNDASGGLLVTEINTLLTTQAPKGSRITKALTAVIAGETVGKGLGLGEAIDKAGNSVPASDKATAGRVALTLNQKLIENDNAPIDQRVNAALSLYGEGNFDFLRKLSMVKGKDGLSSMQKTWMQLISPEARASMEKLDKAKPGTLDKYNAFVKNSYPTLVQNIADTLSEASTANYVKASYDPKSGQFKVDVDTSKFKNPTAVQDFLRGGPKAQTRFNGMSYADQTELQMMKDAINSVRSLNIIMVGLKPILEQEGVNTPESVVQALGVNLEGPKRDNFFEWMQNAIPNGYQAVKDGFEDLMVSPPSQQQIQLENNGVIDNSPPTNLQDFIGKAEGADYNTVYGEKLGNNRYNLTGMDVGDVLSLQDRHARRTGSSAAGKYQITQDTLKDAIKAGVVSEDDNFDEATQNKLADWLIEDARKKSGGDPEKFADLLAGRWASLPRSNGKSKYDGDSMGNKATVSRKDLMDMLNS